MYDASEDLFDTHSDVMDDSQLEVATYAGPLRDLPAATAAAVPVAPVRAAAARAPAAAVRAPAAAVRAPVAAETPGPIIEVTAVRPRGRPAVAETAAREPNAAGGFPLPKARKENILLLDYEFGHTCQKMSLVSYSYFNILHGRISKAPFWPTGAN